MKIKRLVVKDLYGNVGYDVKFNDDITFLYGDNGCGKTTILNILTYIITGKIYELFRYSFSKIELSFKQENDKKQQKIIVSYEDSNTILINFISNGESIETLVERIFYNLDEKERKHEYFSEYPILEKINNIFNYVYLPLNRNSSFKSNPIPFYKNKKMSPFRFSERPSFDRYDHMLQDVEYLVSSAYNKSNFLLNRTNEEFSNKILKSFLDVENIVSTNDIVKNLMSFDPLEIDEIKQKYIKVLKTLGKWDNVSDKKVSTFFSSLKNDIIDKNRINDPSFTIEFLFKLSEISKITNIIEQAKQTEQAKKEITRPIDTFVKIVNSYLYNEVTQKEIYINENGNIFLKTLNSDNISINNVSSGEKQIITFFAYLILGLEEIKQSIFIVDEPELSLHLKWQRQFVDSILSVNNDIQLIFATHAPEIIGRHKNKAVKLVPTL